MFTSARMQLYIFHISEYVMFTSARMQLLAWFLQVQTPGRSGGCGSENHIPAGHTYI